MCQWGTLLTGEGEVHGGSEAEAGGSVHCPEEFRQEGLVENFFHRHLRADSLFLCLSLEIYPLPMHPDQLESQYEPALTNSRGVGP